MASLGSWDWDAAGVDFVELRLGRTCSTRLRATPAVSRAWLRMRSRASPLGGLGWREGACEVAFDDGARETATERAFDTDEGAAETVVSALEEVRFETMDMFSLSESELETGR